MPTSHIRTWIQAFFPPFLHQLEFLEAALPKCEVPTGQVWRLKMGQTLGNVHDAVHDAVHDGNHDGNVHQFSGTPKAPIAKSSASRRFSKAD